MAKSVKCIINGREVTLSEGAFEMAKQYFGAKRLSDLIAAKPIELSKPLLIPKPLTKEIIAPKVVEEKPVTKEVIEEPKPVAKKRVVKKAKK